VESISEDGVFLKRCKALHAFVKDNPALVCVLELAAFGMRDGPRGLGCPSTAQRLQRMRLLREAWDAARHFPKFGDFRPTPSPHCLDTYHLLDKALLLRIELDLDEEGYDSSHSDPESHSPGPEDKSQICTFEFMAQGFPSYAYRAWDVGMTYVQDILAMDESQDLVTFVEMAPGVEASGRDRCMGITVHLRKLSASDIVHPESTSRCSKLVSNMWIRGTDLSFDIVNDVIGFCEVDEFQDLWAFIWNWKIGEELLVSHFPFVGDVCTQSSPPNTDAGCQIAGNFAEGRLSLHTLALFSRHFDRQRCLALPPRRSGRVGKCGCSTSDVSTKRSYLFVRLSRPLRAVGRTGTGRNSIWRRIHVSFSVYEEFKSNPRCSLWIVIRGCVLQRLIRKAHGKGCQEVGWGEWGFFFFFFACTHPKGA
jgi:hypothetical protein